MNPCAKNRELIALLALDELGLEPARELRTHLEICEGCRRYYDEISTLTDKLSLLETAQDIKTSAAFHRRVVNALKTEAPARENALLTLFRLSLANWRVAGAVTGAVAVLLAALVVFAPAHRAPLPAPVMANTVPPPGFSSDLAPTIANYQMVASRSLDKLDDLLTRQGDRNSPPAPIYTASDFARAGLSN
jgi:hypothetical protein